MPHVNYAAILLCYRKVGDDTDHGAERRFVQISHKRHKESLIDSIRFLKQIFYLCSQWLWDIFFSVVGAFTDHNGLAIILQVLYLPHNHRHEPVSNLIPFYYQLLVWLFYMLQDFFHNLHHLHLHKLWQCIFYRHLKNCN